MTDARLHPAAARGFTTASDAYARGRPGYPPAAVDLLASVLAVGPGRRVLDLAAGTGLLTRELVGRGADVIAVEPLAAMRAHLVEELPGLPVLDGTAEAIPLGTAAVEAVSVGQAFHWFATRAALDEVVRVLRPGGRLGLVWNSRDLSTPWVAAVSALLEPHRGDTPTHHDGVWRRALDAHPAFGPLREETVAWVDRRPLDEALDRYASVSFVSALDAAPRRRLLEAIRARLDAAADADGTVGLPYTTLVAWCDVARPSAA